MPTINRDRAARASYAGHVDPAEPTGSAPDWVQESLPVEAPAVVAEPVPAVHGRRPARPTPRRATQ